MTEAPVVWDEILEIRQLLIDTAMAMKTIDPKDFFDRNWFLTTTGETWPSSGKQVTAAHLVGPNRDLALPIIRQPCPALASDYV